MTTKRVGFESDSWSEDYYQDKGYVTLYEEPDSFMPNILSFHSRATGPPHAGSRSITLAIKRFYNLMSNRSNRFVITTHTRSSKVTAEVMVYIKNLNLTMKNHTFDSADPIRIFYFISPFLNEAYMFNMSEAQSFIVLPTFLGGPAEIQFRINISRASRQGGITGLPEAIQCLLPFYATSSAMYEVLYYIRNIL